MDAAEAANLALELVADAAITAADQQVWLDADRAQLLHRVLGGLGLQFAGGADVGQQSYVHIGRVMAAHIAAKLTYRLQKWQRFDIAHGAANFGDHHVGAAVGRHPMNALADFAGDVGDHLHRAAVVVAAPLLIDHRLVDRTGGDAVQPRHGRVGEALVVAQIQVGLGAVFRNEHLPVLVGAHRARVDVEVGIQLQDRDAVAAAFQQPAQAGGHDALADAGNHPAGDKNEFAHGGKADPARLILQCTHLHQPPSARRRAGA